MKTLSTAFKDALSSGRHVFRMFAKFNLASGDYGFWDDVGNVTVDGVEYVGSGTLGEVSPISGVGDMSIPGVQAKLSGIDGEVLNTFFNETWHQRAAALSIGVFDADTRNLIGTDKVFDGYMDTASLDGGAGKEATLTVTLEDVARRMTRSFANVRSDADQRERDPTDTLFKRVAYAAQKTVYWGQPTPASGQVRGGGTTKQNTLVNLR